MDPTYEGDAGGESAFNLDDFVRKRTHATMTGTPDHTGGGMETGPSTPGQKATKMELKNLNLAPADEKLLLELPEKDSLEQRIRADGFGKYLDEVPIDISTKKALYFLYLRNFHEKNRELRVKEIQTILASKDQKRGPFQRLMDIVMHSGDKVLDEDQGIKQDCDKWARAVRGLYECGGEGDGCNDSICISVFGPNPKVDMVFRFQKAESCFIQAPAVVQAYKVQQGSTVFQGMLNMSKYIRNNYKTDMLSQYIVHGGGGDSKLILQDIIDQRRLACHSWPDSVIAADLCCECGDKCNCMETSSILQNLKEYGPALVSTFDMAQNFLEADRTEFDGTKIPFFDGRISQPLRNEEGKVLSHAMVLVGARRVDKKWRLLLQNWWQNMQFVEVSPEYMASCKAELFWLTKNHTEIPSKIPTLTARCAESYVEGGPGDCYINMRLEKMDSPPF